MAEFIYTMKNVRRAIGDKVILDNVTMWLREYHVDGFRLDAVHALADSRATHILEDRTTE